VSTPTSASIVHDPTSDLHGGPLLAAISNELVRLFRKHYGRGPTMTRTVVIEDMVVCRMTEPFTTAERTLIGLGRLQEVAGMRREIRERLDEEYSAVIEELTKRPVAAHVSGVHADPDVCVEVFFLDGHTLGDPAPGEA
jgi:uncharacterized protein YbcI